MLRYEKFAPQLQALGYDTTPVNGKRAFLPNWSQRPAHDPTQFGGCNIGVLTGGKHQLIAIDADITDPASALQLEKAIQTTFGDSPKRIGKIPKFLCVFRCDELLKKKKVSVEGGELEILGEGQQFVASGIHPDGMKYNWPQDKLIDYPANELALINYADLNVFLEAIAKKPKSNRLNLAEGPEVEIENISNGHWHGPVRDYVARLVAKGIGRHEGITLCAKGFQQSGYSLEQTKKQVAKLWDSAVNKGFAPTPSKPLRSLVDLAAIEVKQRDALHPWLPSGFSLLAGSPKAGKSKLLEFIAYEVAQKERVLFAALEYSVPSQA